MTKVLWLTFLDHHVYVVMMMTTVVLMVVVVVVVVVMVMVITVLVVALVAVLAVLKLCGTDKNSAETVDRRLDYCNGNTSAATNLRPDNHTLATDPKPDSKATMQQVCDGVSVDPLADGDDSSIPHQDSDPTVSSNKAEVPATVPEDLGLLSGDPVESLVNSVQTNTQASTAFLQCTVKPCPHCSRKVRQFVAEK